MRTHDLARDLARRITRAEARQAAIAEDVRAGVYVSPRHLADTALKVEHINGQIEAWHAVLEDVLGYAADRHELLRLTRPRPSETTTPDAREDR